MLMKFHKAKGLRICKWRMTVFFKSHCGQLIGDNILFRTSSPAFVFNSNAEAKVLSNLDLLGLIFSNLTKESSSNHQSSNKRISALSRGRRHLLQVGLTCKAFFDPAMSHLWYEMDGVLPMLRLIAKVELKGGAYVCLPYHSKLNFYLIKLIFCPFQTTRKVILERDIRRLELYGSWTRHIQISSFTEQVSGHIYAAIARYTFGKPSCLFPALRNLRIHSLCDISRENLQFLPLLASSPLSSIEIKNVTDSCKVHLASFLHEISRLHSAGNHPVSTLYLAGVFGLSVLPHLIGFTGISKLTLVHRAAYFYIENLQYFANHPLLSVLELDLCTDETRGIKPSPNNAVHTFQQIQTLSVSGSGDHILGILRYIYGERLSQVELKFLGLDATDVLRACIFRCTTMTPILGNLQLSFSTVTIPKDLFAPLRDPKLPLRSLQVKSHLIDRPLFQALFQDAGEWSDLEVLKLELQSTRRLRLPVDVPDLITLPLLCASFPKLHTLEIYLCHPNADAAGIEALLRSQMQTMGQSNHGLVNLKILFLDPSSVIPFAMRDITLAIATSRFFNYFFPNLRHLDISHHQQSAYPSWKDWCRGVVEMTTNCKELTR